MSTLFNKKELMRLFQANSYLETNISELFFSEKFVYKTKRSIDLGFVDLTRQSGRNRMSAAEFQINRTISPSIYLKLIPISRDSAGRLVIRKSGRKSFEYAQKMIRLPANGALLSLLSGRKVDKRLTLKLAKAIAETHKRLRPFKTSLRYGRKEVIKKNLEYIFSLIGGDFCADILSRAQLKELISKSKAVFQDNVSIFEKRLNEKKIQRIHGDLHAENVFVKDGTLFITDATLPIPDWQYGDCAIDLGALAMDFDAYKSDTLGNVLVSEYARVKKDDSIKQIIPFYKLYWALIRLWANLHAYKQGIRGSEKKARMYKDLIFRYLEI